MEKQDETQVSDVLEAATSQSEPETAKPKKKSSRSAAKTGTAGTTPLPSKWPDPVPTTEAPAVQDLTASDSSESLPLEVVLGAATVAPDAPPVAADAAKPPRKNDKPASKSKPAPAAPETDSLETTPMSAGANLAEAGRSLLRLQLEKLREAEPIAREGIDPEGVHDMRVATRRLRAMLKVLEETVYEPKVTAKFRGKLRKLANALGATRDNDVFLEHLNKYRADLSEEEQTGLQPLLDAVTERRDEAHAQMLKVLDSSKTARLLTQLEKFVNKPGAGNRRKMAAQNEVAPNLVRHFAGSAIFRRYEEVLAYESAINPQTPIEVLHRLRVAGKRLRYTLEFFQDALPDTVKGLLKQLTNIQDDLGSLHDRQVSIELCKEILSDHPEDVALHLYQSRQAAEIVKLREAFTAKWQTFSGAEYRQTLAASIGKGAF